MSDPTTKVKQFPEGIFYSYSIDVLFGFTWDVSTNLTTIIEMKDAKMCEMRIKYPNHSFTIEITKIMKEKYGRTREVEVISTTMEYTHDQSEFLK